MKSFVTVFVVSGLVNGMVAPSAQGQQTQPVLPQVLQPPQTPIRSTEESPALQTPKQQAFVRHPSYHMHILAIDLLSVGILLTSGVVEGPELAYGGLAVYALGAASFHLIGRQRSARVVAQSALMRIGFPIVAGVAGYHLDKSTCNNGEWLCGAGGAALGILGGALAAAIIDNVYLAAGYDEDGVDRKRAKPALANLGASVAPTRGGAGLVVSGAF